jgi:HPt (histidine-containing phosphotransfer) domain-containing protein
MNKSYDLPKLRELFSNNEAMVRKMLMLFVNSTPPLIIQIQEAQKMERYKEVSQVIHKIKSSVKTLGAVELGELCQKLESYASEPDASPIRINEMLQEALSKIQHLLQEIQQDLQ